MHRIRLSRRVTLQFAGAGTLSALLANRFAPTNAQDASPVSSLVAACVITTDAENLALAQRWFSDVLNQQNLDAVDELANPEVNFDPPNVSSSTGIDGIKHVLTSLFSAFPDVQYVTAETLSNGGMVVIRWTATGTQLGTYLGIAPTHAAQRWSGIHFFQITCGKISDIWAEADVLSQVGLAEPDAAPTATATANAGATTQETSATACPDSTPEEMAAFAKQWMAVWSSHDVTQYDSFVSPDAVHHFGVGPDAVGRAAIEAGLTSFFEGFSNLEATIASIVVDGNLVAFRYTDTGVQDGEFLGAAPHDEPVTWTGITILRVSCGQVVESWGEADGLAIWQQLGLLDSEATPAA